MSEVPIADYGRVRRWLDRLRRRPSFLVADTDDLGRALERHGYVHADDEQIDGYGASDV